MVKQMIQRFERLSATDRPAWRAVTNRLLVPVLALGLWTSSGLSVSWAASAEAKGAGQTQQTAGLRDDTLAAEMRDKWGIEVLAMRRTAAGYMLDFRYRVVDAAKAAPLLEYRTKPYIKVEKSGATLGVPISPKVGSLRNATKNVKSNRNYFALFANPGKHVKAGDKITIVIGDFRAEHLIVQ
jgi:hypothetical protein